MLALKQVNFLLENRSTFCYEFWSKIKTIKDGEGLDSATVG
jgi:hypothetical protein